jgi:acyl carrier protein
LPPDWGLLTVPKSATGHAGRVPTTVAEIAAEVLAKTPESIRTQAPRESFVGLGGSSMDAVRLLALCERRLGRTLDLARLLSSSPLADVLAEATACQVMADPAGRTDQLREILPAQRGLLMAEAPGAKGALRTLVSAELTGPLDGAALHETLRWIVARHEALLTYVLLRFAAWLSRRGHSFTRLFALLRSALWQKLELRSLLEVYGTAGGGGWFLGTPEQAFLAGFS